MVESGLFKNSVLHIVLLHIVLRHTMSNSKAVALKTETSAHQNVWENGGKISLKSPQLKSARICQWFLANSWVLSPNYRQKFLITTTLKCFQAIHGLSILWKSNAILKNRYFYVLYHILLVTFWLSHFAYVWFQILCVIDRF